MLCLYHRLFSRTSPHSNGKAYGKKIVKSVPLETLSGPVIYTNLLGILPMMALATVGNEYSKLWDFWWSNADYRLPPQSIPLLIIGCLVGTGIGYSSWWCRGLISATSFTLIGGKSLSYQIPQVDASLLPSLSVWILFLRLTLLQFLEISIHLLSYEQVFDNFGQCDDLGQSCDAWWDRFASFVYRRRNHLSTSANARSQKPISRHSG